MNGVDVTNVPQHVFFNLLRASDKVAKIQILKIPVSKVCNVIFFFSSLLEIIEGTFDGEHPEPASRAVGHQVVGFFAKAI